MFFDGFDFVVCLSSSSHFVFGLLRLLFLNGVSSLLVQLIFVVNNVNCLLIVLWFCIVVAF